MPDIKSKTSGGAAVRTASHSLRVEKSWFKLCPDGCANHSIDVFPVGCLCCAEGLPFAGDNSLPIYIPDIEEHCTRAVRRSLGGNGAFDPQRYGDGSCRCLLKNKVAGRYCPVSRQPFEHRAGRLIWRSAATRGASRFKARIFPGPSRSPERPVHGAISQLHRKTHGIPPFWHFHETFLKKVFDRIMGCF